jgi:hypothetical protein
MFSSEQYRAKAAEYLELAIKTDSPNEIREFRDPERSYTVLADNEEWLEHNFDKIVHAPDKDRPEGDALAAEEQNVLRCLGAAVIMQWNNIPKKLQRELFDSAGSMGDLLSTKTLRGKVARFEGVRAMVGKEFENTSEKQDFSDEAWSMRLPDHVCGAVQCWAEKQPNKPSLSEAIERLVEIGVTD